MVQPSGSEAVFEGHLMVSSQTLNLERLSLLGFSSSVCIANIMESASEFKHLSLVK